MPAVVRAYGTDFDVDGFLAACDLPICAVNRRGEARRPASQPDGPRNQRSGVHISVSDADFDDFAGQVTEAIDFLRKNNVELQRLCGWGGVDDVTLDFGIERRDVALQCDYFPAELVRLAGLLGMGIELSQYPIPVEPDPS